MQCVKKQFAAGQHGGNSKPGNEAAQKSLDRRAAHLILTGARYLLKTRAAELKAQVAQFNQVLGTTPGQAGHSPNGTQKMTPVSLPPMPSPLTSPTATPVILPTEVGNPISALAPCSALLLELGLRTHFRFIKRPANRTYRIISKPKRKNIMFGPCAVHEFSEVSRFYRNTPLKTHLHSAIHLTITVITPYAPCIILTQFSGVRVGFEVVRYCIGYLSIHKTNVQPK